VIFLWICNADKSFIFALAEYCVGGIDNTDLFVDLNAFTCVLQVSVSSNI
jgi:hypothetical protein